MVGAQRVHEDEQDVGGLVAAPPVGRWRDYALRGGRGGRRRRVPVHAVIVHAVAGDLVGPWPDRRIAVVTVSPAQQGAVAVAVAVQQRPAQDDQPAGQRGARQDRRPRRRRPRKAGQRLREADQRHDRGDPADSPGRRSPGG